MAETYFAQQLQLRLISTRCLLERQDKHNKIRLRSLPSEQLKCQSGLSNRSPRSPIVSWETKSQKSINLPNLLFKAKKSKLPTNASKNTMLEYDYRDEDRGADDFTYEMIKLERRKIEEKRHFAILGRVYGENHRKELKSLWALKRSNRANKSRY